MRQRFWRRLVAAAVGAVALAGSASAQTQTPPPPLARVAATQPVPQPMPPVAVVAAQPAPGPTVPTVPTVVIPTAPTGAAVEPVAPPAPVPGVVVAPPAGGGCNTPGCGTAARGFVMSASGGYFGTNCSTGASCNNGCGSLKSDAGFVLGSCKSFFSPCGPGALGCGHRGNGTLFGRCHVPVQGTGPCGPFNPCVYDTYYSYLQH